jgi:hypothetical protein
MSIPKIAKIAKKKKNHQNSSIRSPMWVGGGFNPKLKPKSTICDIV